MEPTPIRLDSPGPSRASPFLLGVGIGSMPLVILFVVLGIVASEIQRTPGTHEFLAVLIYGTALSLAAYAYLWIVTIVLLVNERTRFVGRGALAALAASVLLVIVAVVLYVFVRPLVIGMDAAAAAVASPVIAFIGCSVIPNLFQ